MLGEIVKQLKDILATKNDITKFKKDLEMKLQNILDSLLNLLQKQIEKINEIAKDLQSTKHLNQQDYRALHNKLDSLSSTISIIFVMNLIIIFTQVIIIIKLFS